MAIAEDKRIQKTRRAILSALSRLLLTRSPDEITVTELSEAAGIHRKTFYAHYESVAEADRDLDARFAEFIDSYLRAVPPGGGILPARFVRLFGLAYGEKAGMFDAIFLSPRYLPLSERMTGILRKKIAAYAAPGNPGADLTFPTAFLTGGIFAAYRAWVLAGKTITHACLTESLARAVANGRIPC